MAMSIPQQSVTMLDAGIYVKIGTMNPEVDKEGKFKWPVRFALAGPAFVDGWIIQRITARTYTYAAKDQEIEGQYEVKHGDTWLSKAAPAVEYWEAWKVKAGTAVVDHGNQLTDYDDEYEQAGESNSRGMVKVEGRLKFYTGELLASFLKPHPRTRALGLWSTDQRPAFWNESGATRHDLQIRWSPEGVVCFTFSPDRAGPFPPKTSSSS